MLPQIFDGVGLSVIPATMRGRVQLSDHVLYAGYPYLRIETTAT